MLKLRLRKNERFGHLTALKGPLPGGKGIGSYWLFKCDCGSEVELLSRKVSSGKALTCGKCNLHTNLRSAGKTLTRGQRRQYTELLSTAPKLELSTMKFKSYLFMPCLTCGDSKKEANLLITRMDHHKEYTEENMTVMCETCRSLRGNRSVYLFLAILEKIDKHMSSDKH